MSDWHTRRRFARNVAAGADLSVTALVRNSVAADAPKLPNPADLLLAMLQARFPDRLDDARWKEVRGKIEGGRFIAVAPYLSPCC